MDNIIDDLYLGNINPNENTRIQHAEYLKLGKHSCEIEAVLRERLNKEDKKLFEDFTNAMGTMNAIEVRLRFIEGFRLGAQILLDVLTCPELE